MFILKALAGLLLAWILIIITGGIHKIEEGHVGVYYIRGILQPKLTSPGYNYLTPFLTTYHPIQITVQTDVVTNIPCGISGGVMIVFDRIEVVNRLKKEYVYETIKNYSINYDKIWIYDKIHHEINQFCTKHTLKEVYTDLFDNLDESLIMALAKDCEIWAPGIEIIAIRVTKPRIPERIKKNFEEMESQRTKLLVVIENQKLRMQEAETQKRQELIKTQSAFEVSKINIEREIQEQLNKQKLAKMENENYLKKIISEANAQHYIANKELETVQQRLTGRYLMHEAIESLTNNLKLNIGNNIPEAIIQNDQEFDMLNVFGKKANSKNI